MKILVIGDSFVPLAVFKRAFHGLSGEHEIRFEQLNEEEPFEAATPSELRISEFLGTPAQVAALLGDAEALVVHGAPVTEEVLTATPRLRLLACARGGPVNVDVSAATRRGIPVAIAAGRNAQAVADLTLALMVMLARDLPRAQRTLLDAGGHMSSNFGGARFMGTELEGATLGLVGFGNVGRRVAARALGFGMHILVHDPYIDPGVIAEPITLVKSRDVLLAQADIVSLHARLMPNAARLIDAPALAGMKPGSLLVNTARAALIDERALAAALDSGHVAGAALDVLTTPPAGERHPLIDHPRVIVTPHIGGATHETLARGARMMADAVADVAGGRVPAYLANPEVMQRGHAER